MTKPVTFDSLLMTITEQVAQLVQDATAAGPATLVPSCPGWTVADLLGHVGMVHRWATLIVAGAHAGDRQELAQLERQAKATTPADPDRLPDWVRTGAGALVDTLAAAPPDLTALVFLRNAPAARHFWARRQAHETTMHRVDALSARLGRLPTASQVDLDAGFAADGLDELLTGFLPRRRSGLHTDEPVELAVLPNDVDRSWTVELSADAPRTLPGAKAETETVFSGTAAGLYLGLWNRGDEIAEAGYAGILGLWRDRMRISWS